MPKTLKQLLGQTYDEVLNLNDKIIEQNEDELRQLRRAFEEREEQIKDLESQNKKLSNTIVEKEMVEGKLRAQLEKSTSPGERKRLNEELAKVKRDLERSKNQNKMRENNAEIERLRQQQQSEDVQRQIERLEQKTKGLASGMRKFFHACL